MVRSSLPKRQSGGNSGSNFNLSVLGKRIAFLQSQEAANKAIARRPSLPTNTQLWNEIEQDHRLIVNWHEQAWKELRDN